MNSLPVDHALVKAHFEPINAEHNAIFERAVGGKYHEIHFSNPFNRFVFGRAQWTYVSQAVAEQIEQVSRGLGTPYSSDPKPCSYVNYCAAAYGAFKYLPPSSGLWPWLELFTVEWAYATDEQRLLGKRCVEQIMADGILIPEALQVLIQRSFHEAENV